MLQNKPMDREQFIDQDFLFVTNRAARDIFNAFLSPENAMRAWKVKKRASFCSIPSAGPSLSRETRNSPRRETCHRDTIL